MRSAKADFLHSGCGGATCTPAWSERSEGNPRSVFVRFRLKVVTGTPQLLAASIIKEIAHRTDCRLKTNLAGVYVYGRCTLRAKWKWKRMFQRNTWKVESRPWALLSMQSAHRSSKPCACAAVHRPPSRRGRKALRCSR